MTRQVMREKFFLKNRLNGPLKPIMGKIYEKNAPGFWRNDTLSGSYLQVFANVKERKAASGGEF
jgi:hypothetical protein